MDPLMQWIFASIFSCLVCASASTDPIVLFCTSYILSPSQSSKYRKAFCKQFKWLSVFHKPNINPVKPMHTTGIITKINMKQMAQNLRQNN
ncbi:hypothetical protein Mgra_00003487 [Meloidogyne graminicola]|uniref:Secreted protein n=1 Tax=Meloidogyne graminicola TaxID=189291 RepID=A0A8S9ZV64_9BILA|nr:hypothetical protein Mgra_00003487 [Meloidogyne graminicola]